MTKNGTQDGTPKGENTPLAPDLTELVTAWPSLPDDAKRNILHVVRSYCRAYDAAGQPTPAHEPIHSEDLDG